jgi:hypothetical protein
MPALPVSSGGGAAPTPAPTTPPTPAPVVTYYKLDSCTEGYGQLYTAITPGLANQKYIDSVTLIYYIWDNTSTTSPGTIGGNLQIVSGQAGCATPAPVTLAPTAAPVVPSTQYNIYTDSGLAPFGYASSNDACAGSGAANPSVYVEGTGYSSFYDAVVINGKALKTNATLATAYNGNNTWFKTTNSANTGGTFLVGTDGAVSSFNQTACNTPAPVTPAPVTPPPTTPPTTPPTEAPTQSPTPAPVPSPSLTINTSCSGGVNSGVITVSATGGSGNYTYHIGTTPPGSFNGLDYASGLSDATYYVGAYDNVYGTQTVTTRTIACTSAPTAPPTTPPTSAPTTPAPTAAGCTLWTFSNSSPDFGNYVDYVDCDNVPQSVYVSELSAPQYCVKVGTTPTTNAGYIELSDTFSSCI